jgi:hypothetical protein
VESENHEFSQEGRYFDLFQHTNFYSIGYEHFLEAKKLHAERERLLALIVGRDPTPQELPQLVHAGLHVSRASVITVVFCALALEAFINDYALGRLGKSLFKAHLDRMPILSKWMVLPMLISGKTLEAGGKPYLRIKNLFRLRDKIAHYKSRRVRPDRLAKRDLVVFPDAEKAIEAVRTGVAALNKIDSNANKEWVAFTESGRLGKGAIIIPRANGE